jgi:type I restriction-modification system DNA methylase subunit
VSTLSALSGVQQGLPGMCAIEEAVSALSSSGTEERGAIFTKREVADFILDLVGYTTDKDLRNVRLLEPSFGAGDFLIPSLERLLDSWDRFGNKAKPLELTDSIQAVEIHRE